ncbi:gastrokine-1 [Phaenicophaeus curvirostris]|uniref:gastrokine-1 n=1 Tax=Phaenicophaeus curvirostris TaxID=33595 RepID=UPI0037F0CCFC
MKFSIVIASLLGVLLAPALAERKGKEDFKGHHDESSSGGAWVRSNSEEGSDWKSVWDVKTGYAATKIFSKNVCVIAKLEGNFPEKPAPAQGHKGHGPQQLPPTENRFIISRRRLQNLHPYGELIQALCRGIPSYLASPAVGSNFLQEQVSCWHVHVKELFITKSLSLCL